MSEKTTSGYCRWIAITCILLLALCASVSGAATLNPNLVNSKITAAVTVIQTPAAVSCPAGCSCMMEADAKAKFGTYSRCSETPCSVVNTGSTSLKAYCFRQGTLPTTTTPAPACPVGCNCLSDAQAKDRYGTYTRCSDTVCGYDIPTNVVAAYQIPKYCVKPGSTTPSCPEGCVCITDALAKQRYGTYTRCSADVCGYDPSQTPEYCIKQGSSPVCPEGCTCISEAVAKDRYGTYTRCTDAACGYEQDQTPKYCIKQGTTTPACPEGCSCISEATAKAKGGTWARCTGDICGYEQSTATLAAVVQVPKYCMKQQETTPSCPEGCTCISDEDAKLKGLTDRCDNSQTPCGYKPAATTANQQIPMYCYKLPVTTTSTCPEGCYCLQETDAKLKFGPNNYSRCKSDICGTDPSAASANGIPKYCFRPTTTPTSPVCPQGCACVTNATGVEKGLSYCGGKVTLCGYNENKVAMHCFTTGATPSCPQGCVCTTDEIAKLKGLTPCRGQRTSCGYNSDKQPLYCFEQVPSPTCVYDYQKNACTGTCPDGYSCGVLATEKDASGKIVYGVCGCTGQPSTPCVFDAQKNACTGSCQAGAACTVVGKQVDEKTGAVAVTCGCPQPPSGQCTYDKDKKACTGTCSNGAACTVTGTKKDDAGNEYVFCGCPQQQSSCVYDYGKEACAGTCPLTGDNCVLNTIYHDQTSGKVTYAECHCKGSGGTPDTCAFNADHYCVGSCPQGGQCANTSVVDATGKQSFVCTCAGGGSECALTANNECAGTCGSGHACSRIVSKDDSGNEKVSCICAAITLPGGSPVGTPAGQQGFFEGIGEFFRRFFGGK